jgi:hypothetical protein
VDELVGAAEIAKKLGAGKSTVVHDWRRRHDDFPEPVAELQAGLVWAWPDVEKWARATLRPIDAEGTHSAVPVQLSDGKWVAYCTACGKVGVGPTLDSKTQAQLLVNDHHGIHTP